MSTGTNPLMDETNYTRAAYDVIMERAKQRTKWSAANDDDHTDGAIRIAAASLAVDGTDAFVAHPDGEGDMNYDRWGLVHKYGHAGVTPNKRKCLVVAAALLLAEIERIDRAGAK